MIIKALMLLLKNVLSVLLVFDLPGFPQPLVDALAALAEYCGTGVLVLKAFIGDSACATISVLLGVIITLEVFKKSWSLIWFFIRKIPMLNIKE